MRRRFSAYELQLLRELRGKIGLFANLMLAKMRENLEEKGDSWKRCSTDYLKKKLLEHAKVGNWVSVANYAFMLDDNEREEVVEG